MKLSPKMIIICVAVAIAVVTVLLITFGGGLGVPTWKQVFSQAGLGKISQTEGDLTVHFIDVGKADSILINSGDHNILIDAGLESINKITEGYLKERGVEKLDLVIATHQDKDHIGDMSGIIKDFQVADFWMPMIPAKLIPNTACYNQLTAALENKGLKTTQPQVGQIYTYGDIKLQVIAPVLDDYSDINNYSIAVKLTYGENTFLLMGDAMEKSEKDILKLGEDIKADVLKVGHHGSDTGTTEDFLQAVSPRYAVICVGENDNGLPKKSVVKRLEKAEISVYRTDEDGTVVFSSDGKKLTVITEK